MLQASTKQIVVEHLDGCLALEKNIGNDLLFQEFGDHRDLIQQELFIQYTQEAIEVEVNIAEEPSQKISGLVQPPRTVHLTKNQPDISSESLQQKNASVTRPNGKDQEGEDGNMR